MSKFHPSNLRLFAVSTLLKESILTLTKHAAHMVPQMFFRKHTLNCVITEVLLVEFCYSRTVKQLTDFTLPPAGLLTAKQKRVEGLAFPSILNSAKAAAWPSIGWETFLSTEYSCIAPTTRFC